MYTDPKIVEKQIVKIKKEISYYANKQVTQAQEIRVRKLLDQLEKLTGKQTFKYNPSAVLSRIVYPSPGSFDSEYELSSKKSE